MGRRPTLHGNGGSAACRPAGPVRRRPRRRGRGVPNYKKEEEGYGAIRALDPKTGDKEWDFKMVNYTENGVLSTAGDLMFGGGMDGTSSPSMHVPVNCCGTPISAAPTPAAPLATAVDGKQYVVGTGEGTMYVFGLPD